MLVIQKELKIIIDNKDAQTLLDICELARCHIEMKEKDTISQTLALKLGVGKNQLFTINQMLDRIFDET